MDGTVEVDEAFVGGITPGTTGREGEGKAMGVIAAEEDQPGIGRMRLQRVAEATSFSLPGFIPRAIGPGSTVQTEGGAPYQGWDKLGYLHVAAAQR